MRKHALRDWIGSLVTRRHSKPIHRVPAPVRLGMELFEDRCLPSASIPLNGLTWTPLGPSPITNGQSPGSPTATGRLNGVAVDPSDPNVIYVAADTGGIWRTTDGGQTWSPRTDQQQEFMQTIAMVNRGTNDTVYAASQDGALYISTDGATTFNATAPFPPGSVVNKLTVVVADPNDQTKDILYAAVGSVYGFRLAYSRAA